MKKFTLCIFILVLAGCSLNTGVSAQGGSAGIGFGFGISSSIRF